MEFTGERVIPGQVDPDLWAEHFSRYRFAATLAPQLGKKPDVLDIGCGSGYGTSTLAEVAATATGIDLAPEAVEHARANYNRPNLTYLPGSATDLPFPDQSFDLITAFEVIEHLSEPVKLLSEGRRVLRPGGVFLVSTPNQTYYAETRGSSGPNPYHLHEFTFEEFREALTAVFGTAEILLQNHTDAFSFSETKATVTDALIETVSASPVEAHFFLAVCPAGAIPELRNFVYVPTATNLLRTREHHIGILQLEVENLKASIDTLQASLAKAHAERDKMIGMYDDQAKTLAERTEWALHLDHEFKNKVAHLKIVTDALRDSDYAVSGLQEEITQIRAELDAAYKKMRIAKNTRWMQLGRKFNFGPVLEVPEETSEKDTHHDA